MGIWNDRILPHLAHRTLDNRLVAEMRRRALDGLGGEVLEIGFGSGLNVPLYPTGVTRVDAVEPSEVAWRMSEGRRAASPVPVEHVGLDGQRLSADDERYDAALSTFSLCTIPDVASALAEVRRVLRPGGSFYFLEHGISPDPQVARWQRRLDPLQRRIAGGCHLSRDIPQLITSAGLEIVALETEYLPGPAVSRPWTHGFLGRARVAS